MSDFKMKESNRIELKRELSSSLERGVVAFLNNHDGGMMYVGIGDDGETVGVADCDAVQLKIKDRLKNNIQPSCMGLFNVLHESFVFTGRFIRAVLPIDPEALKMAQEEEGKGSPKSSPKTSDRILELIRNNPSISTEAMGEHLEISKRAIIKQTNKLQEIGRLKRIGPLKGGHWEVVE